MIKARARIEAKKLNIDFKASNGWLDNWLWRNAIGASARLHGEAGDVDAEIMEPKIEILRQLLVAYKLDNIFNMDETGLCFRCLPTRSYDLLSNKVNCYLIY